MKPYLSKNTLLVFLLLSLTLSACGASAPVVPPTATMTNTPVPPTFTPTITLTPTITPQPTATPNLAATQEYEDFVSFVQQVYDAGQITTLDGTYIKLDDYSDELASNYGYRWDPTGMKAKDFIIRASFDWEVANQKNYSGCGYLFRQEEPSASNNFGAYYYIVTLDGINGILFSYTGGSSTGVANYTVPLVKKLEKPDVGSNPYQAEFTLVVNDTAAYTYVNGNLFTEHKLKGNWLTESGSISSLILTGSEKDYGTRCKITNAELWVIE